MACRQRVWTAHPPASKPRQPSTPCRQVAPTTRSRLNAQEAHMAKDIQLDPRGYRVGAAITLLVALVALIFGAGTAGLIAIGILTAMFIPGAFIGPQATVQAAVFKALIRPRIGPPTETEPFQPARFAQQMGLAMAAAALVLGLLGIAPGFYIFAALVTVASFLNAAFGFCLGCEIYLLLKRSTTRPA